MKVYRRNDPSWILNGTCPFYFFESDPSRPNCFITNSIVQGDANIFETTDEALSFIEHDCIGLFERCPFVHALWDIEGKMAEKVDLSVPIVIKEDPFIQISFGWPYPQTPETSCDVLMIPTNTYLRFGDMLSWNFDDEVLLDILDDISQFEKPAEIGDVISTRGGSSGYGRIIHCVVSGLGGQPMDDVSDVVHKGMEEAENFNAASIVINPMCLTIGGNDGLAQTLFSEMKGILRYLSRQTSSITYVDIVMPPTCEAFEISRAVAEVVSS